MKRTVVRYKTKPEQAEENERLIKRVFQELQAKSPEGVRYLALQLDDGTFVAFRHGRHRGRFDHRLEASGPSAAASKSVASSRRRRARRRSSATIGCWASMETTG